MIESIKNVSHRDCTEGHVYIAFDEQSLDYGEARLYILFLDQSMG